MKDRWLFIIHFSFVIDIVATDLENTSMKQLKIKRQSLRLYDI